MMRILAIIAVLVFGVSAAQADRVDPLHIEQPYAFATTSVQKNGAVFMKIHNAFAHDLKLIKAESDVAERIELHTHTMDGDVMMMREVEGYDIETNGMVTLEPMGHHIMLFDLKQPLELGSEFPMELYFDDESSRRITVKVIKPGETP
jgi:copper(I)-binding protein